VNHGPPIPPTRTIVFQAGMVSILAVTIWFFVAAWKERQELASGLDAVLKEEHLISEIERHVTNGDGRACGAFPDLTSSPAIVWQETEMTLQDAAFTELVLRLSALRAPDRVFVPVSFSASGKEPARTGIKTAMAGETNDDRHLEYRIRGYLLCLAP